MNNFDFSGTAGNSQSSTKRQLEGNKIHDVTFDGCEARDIKGVQDPTQVFKVLDIKFSNAEGTFTDTVWEPKDSDYEDRSTAFGSSPSNVKAMMYKFKHLIDAVNPSLAQEIDKGTKSLTASSWDELRKLMVEATTPGINKTTKIKLIKNAKGDAIFPYFASYDRTGHFYMSTNFIGDNIFWTRKELDRISAVNTAKPAEVNAFTIEAPVQTATTQQDAPATVDWNF